ncbi:hypothetical protein DENIS_0227 [Desulfonema ishimotonii]|uniref:HD domain-containing protein n=1 Tax=Desulfonema ishimotonii TaxID=45657 RepID=A0A401FQQ1_9BACT|nr:HD domain-containing protein [Desulfonema ishimotonii]GBC59290.1 hypothetical protein DENIS_0227 [Desulfonema ishimotonii]
MIQQVPPEILKIFPEKTDGVCLVGGAVRDLLLGRTPRDYDIAVRQCPRKIARRIGKKTNGSVVEMGKAGQNIIRVVSAAGIFDIAPIEGLSIGEDLLRRDFTVNAMAYDLNTRQLIDTTGGLGDLRRKKIRMVSERAFVKDPLRLLRTFRMAASLGFEIDPQTLSAVGHHAHRIRESAGERVRDELLKLFAAQVSFPCLVQMAESGLLYEIFPEMAPLSGCVQNQHHRFDVLEHTFRAFEHLENILNTGQGIPPDIAGAVFPQADTARRALLKYCILLHDVAKPLTRTSDKRGHIHFYGHEQKGADVVEKIAVRLRFSTRETRFITAIVRHHLRPLHLFMARKKNTLTRKGQVRFFMRCGTDTPLLLLHAIADNRAKKEVTGEPPFTAFAIELLRAYFSDHQPRQSEPPLLTGHDLIRVFGLKPSPLFKELLNRVEEERLSGTLTSRQEAVRHVRNLLECM